MIIGGGLAGIAAATALAEHGFAVSLFEARSQLGGRAGSYHDRGSDEIVDNCQHVSMGCCTNLRKLCRSLRIESSFEMQTELHFISPDGSSTRFSEGWLPAPLHLSGAFLRLPYITFREKRLFATAVRSLAKASQQQLRGKCFADWLREHDQTDTLIRRVWEVVLVSALSESLDRIDAAYARKVFVDGFLANREGWRVEIPNASLDEIYSKATATKLESLGVRVIPQSRLRTFHSSEGLIRGAQFSDEKVVAADEFILAVPHHQVGKLLPKEFSGHPTVQMLEQIETAPITSVHLWLDRRLTDLQHAVFVDKLSQWMFARSATSKEQSDGTHRYQIVISASRNLSEMKNEEIVHAVMHELAEVWSEAGNAELIHSRVITEKRAVFSVTPGIDELRPQQQSPVPNLQFAGDWTQTNWPATMEGAVRSGYLAAENVLKKYGVTERVLAPNLKVSKLSRWLLGIKS